ncbi:uncharacterized protein LOC132040688 isoform X2 [Lycium ferocissimum]|uniref:uncharacterized protein LOC132040688 isoform X2 n=1 Tax=Lycium ferocissimum TaxID=112874 RepID=UPI00281637E7|nr:uncharacterized protein LOC132040688 isoform X2 [Lycium ferocissimum]
MENMAKKNNEANITPFITIVMLILISNSQLVYCTVDEKCFRICIRGCYAFPGCYIGCAKVCGEIDQSLILYFSGCVENPICLVNCKKTCQDSLNSSSSPMNYRNLGSSIHKCASLIKDDKQS